MVNGAIQPNFTGLPENVVCSINMCLSVRHHTPFDQRIRRARHFNQQHGIFSSKEHNIIDRFGGENNSKIVSS